MRKYARAICAAIGLLLFLGVWYAMKRASGELLECENTALILLEREPLSARRVKDIRSREEAQEESVSFTAWGQKNLVTAQNTDLRRSRTVSAVRVCGRSDIVLRGMGLDEGDEKGCLIDEKTALELFGSTDAAGLEITVDGREKTVRGILRGAQDTVLCTAGEDDELTMVTLLLQSGASYEAAGESFLMRHGLSGKIVRMDYFYTLATLLCALVFLCAGLCLLLLCARLFRLCGLPSAAAALPGALLLYLAFRQIRLPADMLPARWSDFSFWKNWWAQARESVLLLLLMEKQRPVWHWTEPFLCVCAKSVLSFFLLHFLGRCCYNTSWNKQDVVKRNEEYDKKGNL